MNNNERGGVISKLIIIPAGVALMVGFFFLGFYVGKYESKSGAALEKMPPLPEVVSKNLPKPEEFTFYKTLTDKDGKTVSIDLKPKPQSTENKAETKQPAEARKESEKQHVAKEAEHKAEKKAAPAPSKQAASKPAPVPEKKPVVAKQEPPSNVRFTVQVSSHQERLSAEEEVKRMKQNGFAAFIRSTELPGKGTWYRVRVGSFTKKEAAERLQQQIQAKTGIEPIVVTE